MNDHHYIINKETGARLCRDGLWRTFAHFGTSTNCVKVYRQRGWAWRRAFQRCIGTNGIFVLSLAPNMVMDASGHIYNESKGRSIYQGHCLEMKPKES